MMEKIAPNIDNGALAIFVIDPGERVTRAEKLGSNGWETETAALGYPISEIFANQPKMLESYHLALKKIPSSASLTQNGLDLSAYFSPVVDDTGRLFAVNCILYKNGPQAGPAKTEDENTFFREIVEAAIDVVYIADCHGNFSYVNPPAQKLTGYSAGELIGMHFTNLIPADWRQRVASFYREQYDRRMDETTLEFPIRARDGSEKWVEQTVRLLNDGGRVNGFQSIVRDIDMRKRAELALEESENRYRSLVELSPIAIAVHREGKLVYVNPAGVDLFGAETQDELLAAPFLSFIHPDYRAIAQDRIQQSYENHLPKAPTVGKMVRLDGRMIDVEVASQPVIYKGEPATQVVVKDIGYLKRASEELQRYANRLKILNQIDQAILTANTTRTIAQVVTEQIRKLIPCERVSIALFDMEKMEVRTIALDLSSSELSPSEERFPLHGGFPQNLIENDSLLVEDIRDLPEQRLMEKKLLSQGIRTYLNIPLRVRGNLIGTLNFGASTPGHFSPEYVEIARDLGSPLAVAIEQARLSEEVSTHASQLETRISELRANERYLALLNEITRTALGVDDTQAMLATLEARLGELFNADTCIISLNTIGSRTGSISAEDRDDRPYPWRSSTDFHPMVRSVLESGMSSFWKDQGEEEPRLTHTPPDEAISVLGLPLIAGDRKLGTALIVFDDPRPLSLDEVARAEQTAAQIALALAKAHLLESERQRRQEAETLRIVSNALASTLDLKQVLDLILEQLAVVINYDSAAILLWEDDSIKAVAGRGFRGRSLTIGDKFPLEDVLVDEIRRTSKAIWLSNPNEDSRFNGWGGTKNIRSWMGLPLVVHGKFLGFMTLDSYIPETYGASQAALVQPYANQAAQAIENARLFDWVQRQAITDALTNIYNRRGLFDLGQREVERALRFDRDLVAIMLDIDHFKRVNDLLGHAIGDQVLSEIAGRCLQALRRVDLIGRYGGEEFAILLPETDINSALGIAERLRMEIAEMPIDTDRGSLPVTVSLGVASIHPEVKDLADLLDSADSAMYTAKQAGRNCVRIYQR